MRLRAITLIRDENDIIDLFLRHLDALFDEVILLDHQSVDGTTELLQQAVTQRPTWQYFRVDIKQKMQQQLMNYFIEKFSADIFDYLFFLDCDEFLWVKDRKALETLLSQNQNEVGVYGFEWVNGIPKRLLSKKPIGKNTSLFISSEVSRYQKVAINWKQINTKDLFISEGNHSAHRMDGKVYQNNIIGRILHVPIRSKTQLISKAILSKCSMVMEANRNPSSSYQYSRFLEKIANDKLNDDDLFRFIYYYQVGDDPIPEGWENAFLKQCTTARFQKLSIAQSRELKLRMPKVTASIEKKVANALLNGSVIDPGKSTILLEDETICLISGSPELID